MLCEPWVGFQDLLCFQQRRRHGGLPRPDKGLRAVWLMALPSTPHAGTRLLQPNDMRVSKLWFRKEVLISNDCLLISFASLRTQGWPVLDLVENFVVRRTVNITARLISVSKTGLEYASYVQTLGALNRICSSLGGVNYTNTTPIDFERLPWNVTYSLLYVPLVEVHRDKHLFR